MSDSGQKFVARNRAPRVQIEYDVELYGAEKSIQLPFVMGVMADLSGKSEVPLSTVADRPFLEIDTDNFDERMKAMRPRAAFSVPNTLTGEGNLSVDMAFESMDDFSPAAVAEKVAPLRKLLQARTELAHLLTYMDGKTGAEDLIADFLSNKSAIAATAELARPDTRADGDAALDAMRAVGATLDLSDASDNVVDTTLDALRAVAIEEPSTDTGTQIEDALTAEVATFDDLPAVDGEPASVIFEELKTSFGSETADSDLDADFGPLDQYDVDFEPAFEDDTASDDVDLEPALEDDADEVFDLEAMDDLELSDDAESEPNHIEEPFGTLSAVPMEGRDAPRPKFRIAILGDFSGRANRGDFGIGEDLATRKPVKLDVDDLDAVISRFASNIVLPVGADGAGVEIPLRSLDDLHPDELFENVALFEQLSALRQRVAIGDGAAAIADMQNWAETFGDLNLSLRNRAKGAAVPADCKLGEFQSMLNRMQSKLATPSPAEDLIARIVGPYAQAATDPAQAGMLVAIDEALSGAMRTILHHPDFQAIESTWRAVEMLARRITTGAGLEIVLYDVSAEEWAADLSAQDDLADSGLFQMLGEEPSLDAAQGALSAVFGLYTLEETPPHAELLARMAKISQWMNAPFLTAISPKFLDTPKADRHPLVARAWNDLRALPEAQYIGVAAPRFLMRLPYGQKTEPVDPFDFEEFSLRSGLKGMLWGNPVILSAILLAETVNQNGKDMKLGDVMSLGDMPFYYMTDQHGDQVALPCTERLLNTRTAADVGARGFMPVLSIKGRNHVRQGSFQALGAGLLAGPWGQSAGAGTGLGASSISLNTNIQSDTPPAATADASEPDSDGAFAGVDDLDMDLDDPSLDDFGDDDLNTDDGGDIDDLLSSFGDDDGTDPDTGADDEMDAELAALLEDM